MSAWKKMPKTYGGTESNNAMEEMFAKHRASKMAHKRFVTRYRICGIAVALLGIGLIALKCLFIGIMIAAVGASILGAIETSR